MTLQPVCTQSRHVNKMKYPCHDKCSCVPLAIAKELSIPVLQYEPAFETNGWVTYNLKIVTTLLNRRLFIFLDIPKIRKGPPSSFTTKEGSNISLPCSSNGYPKPEITWYKNDQKLDTSLYNAATGVLTFPSIQFGDRGLYRCEARNFLGFDSTTVKIVVEGMENVILNKNILF